MPISATMAQELSNLSIMYQCPKINERLTQIGEENLIKFMTPERFTRVKNGIKFNDPSKALKALALLPNRDPDNEPSTDKQAYAIFRIGFQWFMPEAIQKLVNDKDLTKLTRLQASIVIDLLKRIEHDTQDADDIETAAKPDQVQAVEMILGGLPNNEIIKKG